MKFYINLEHFGTRFRLLDTMSFRPDTGDFQSGDYVSVHPLDVEKVRFSEQIEITGTTYRINPTSGSLTDTAPELFTHYYARPEAREELHCPTIEQLIATIASGDDRFDNQLILDVYGFFHLNSENVYVPEPVRVTRMETFSAYNDYIGPKASQDHAHIESLFVTGLEAYLEFLKTNAVGEYSDDFGSSRDIPKLLSEITLQIKKTPLNSEE